MTKTFVPAEAFPVGDFILEELRARRWLERDFCEKTGLPRTTLDRLCDGVGKLKEHEATAIAPVFGTSVQFWLDLDTSYRERKYGKRR